MFQLHPITKKIAVEHSIAIFLYIQCRSRIMYRKSCTMYHNTTHYTYNILYFNQLLCGTTYITTCVQLYLVQLYFNSPPTIQQKNPPLTNHEKRKKEIYLNEILYLIMKVIYKFAKMDFLHLLIV